MPVWFVLDGEQIVFTTGANSVKGRNLQRDTRIALVVEHDEPPFEFVHVRGRVTIHEDLDELRRFATAIGSRYMGEDRAEEFGQRNAVPGELLVRVIPERVIADADVSGYRSNGAAQAKSASALLGRVLWHVVSCARGDLSMRPRAAGRVSGAGSGRGRVHDGA